MMGSKDAYLSKINPNQSLQPGYWIFDRYQIVKRTTKRVYFCKTGKRIDEHGEPLISAAGNDQDIVDVLMIELEGLEPPSLPRLATRTPLSRRWSRS